MADEQWFYAKQGTQSGPVSRHVLEMMTRDSRLAPEDLVWTEGMAQWQPARTVAGLYAVSAPQSSSFAQAYVPPAESFARAEPVAPLSYGQPDLAGNYAGFWLRVAAAVIDGVIVSAAGAVLAMAAILVMVVCAHAGNSGVAIGVIAMVLAYIVFIVGSVLYGILFEASRYQATPGKMALGLVVTDLAGGRITRMRSFGRQLGKMVSGMILYIGFIMVGFSPRKQGLHDMLADTFVVKRNTQK